MISIRISLLYIVVISLGLYAWRDWFKSLCGLILLMAVIEHPDMPKNIMGIQGLNPWNVLMFIIVVAWFVNRRREGLVWDMPRYINVMLLLYLGVVLVGFMRMMADRSHMDNARSGYLVSEFLINAVKWVVPGLLLFDGCRSRRQLTMGLCSILGLYLLLALQVIRWMPPSAALSDATLTKKSRKFIPNEVGYSAVNMSRLLSGASWAIVATLPLWKRRRNRGLVIAAAVAVAYGQALTGGRMGYVTWGVVGLVLCLVRWRKYLVLAPVVLVAVAVALPGVAGRMLQGFGVADVAGETVVDDYQVTSGRTLIWPHVIDKIMESPLLGHGREAMARTGLRDYLWDQYNEGFSHPHNAYLQWLLDNGLVGFLLVMPFYAVIVVHATRLFLDSRDPWCVATGGVTLALVLALLVAGMGSQTFYPREAELGMWAAIGLMLRVSLGRARVRASVPHLTGAYYPARPAARLVTASC